MIHIESYTIIKSHDDESIRMAEYSAIYWLLVVLISSGGGIIYANQRGLDL